MNARTAFLVVAAVTTACATDHGDPPGLVTEGDHCVVTATVSGRDLTATARYVCDVPEVTAYLNAYAKVTEYDYFHFGTHTQILRCGDLLTERYLIPRGVTSEIVMVVAGFNSQEVYCEGTP